MELNNTPIRTSKNFNINNIKLDVEMPQVTEDFKGMKMPQCASVLKEDLSFKFGVGLGFENSNNKIKIDLNNSEEKIVYNFDDENLSLINQILIDAMGDSTITIEYRASTAKKCFRNRNSNRVLCYNDGLI